MSSQQVPQAFCLKLNSHQAHVIDQFQKLYNDQLMCDCTLSCNDGIIKAHKLVLSACSPYFTSLFTQCTQPFQYPMIILKDMSLTDLRILVDFMYRGEVTVSQHLLPSVLESAKALQITGLREIKIANQESKTNDTSNKSAKRRKRKHKSVDGDSTVESDASDALSSDNEENKTSSGLDNQISLIDSVNDDGSESFVQEQLAGDSESIELDQDLSVMSSADHSSKASPASKSARYSQNSNSSPNKTSSTSGLNQINAANSSSTTNSVSSASASAQTHKQNLRQLRMEKTLATTGNSSSRKMWTEEETKCLVRIWQEESERVWASAGKKVLSLQRISDLLMQENVDRDVSQVEGKIKALKRDFKQIKYDKAIPAVQQRMAPYLERLEKITKDEL